MLHVSNRKLKNKSDYDPRGFPRKYIFTLNGMSIAMFYLYKIQMRQKIKYCSNTMACVTLSSFSSSKTVQKRLCGLVGDEFP